MELVTAWWELVSPLKGAFKRRQTFYWFVLVLFGFCVGKDIIGGVTGLVRSIGLDPRYYTRMVAFFHSDAVDLGKLRREWVATVLEKFKRFIITINGRPLLILDGIGIPKEGRRMSGVQCLHQSSQSNSKAEYIMGHFFQFVGILVGLPGKIPFCVLLLGKICLGTRVKGDDRTLFDKAVSMLGLYPEEEDRFYLLGDSYYYVKKMLKGVVGRGADIITRVRANAVAYLPAEKPKKRKRGRPRKYGKKLKLVELFDDLSKFMVMVSPVYGEENVEILYYPVRLLSRTFLGMELKYVLVIHPKRGRIIMVTTDVELGAREIIQAYGLRFKIELSFKVAVHVMGTFRYRFWSRMVDKIPWKGEARSLEGKSESEKEAYWNTEKACEVFTHMGTMAQGILQYLSLTLSEEVWRHFGSWIRTIRPDVLPSEMVAGEALGNNLHHFLEVKGLDPKLRKFMKERLKVRDLGNRKATG